MATGTFHWTPEAWSCISSLTNKKSYTLKCINISIQQVILLKLYVRLIVVCKSIDCTVRVHTKSKLNESNQDQRKDETINMKPVIPKYLETYKLIHIYIYWTQNIHIQCFVSLYLQMYDNNNNEMCIGSGGSKKNWPKNSGALQLRNLSDLHCIQSRKCKCYAIVCATKCSKADNEFKVSASWILSRNKNSIVRFQEHCKPQQGERPS